MDDFDSDSFPNDFLDVNASQVDGLRNSRVKLIFSGPLGGQCG